MKRSHSITFRGKAARSVFEAITGKKLPTSSTAASATQSAQGNHPGADQDLHGLCPEATAQLDQQLDERLRWLAGGCRKPEHSPTPWTTETTRGIFSRGLMIASAHSMAHMADPEAESQANAELICRAVNCHADLIAALTQLEDSLRGASGHVADHAEGNRPHLTLATISDGLLAAANQARAALAKAGAP